MLALAWQANARLVLPSAMYGDNHRFVPRVVTCDAESHFDCGFEVGMKTRDLIEAAFAVWDEVKIGRASKRTPSDL